MRLRAACSISRKLQPTNSPEIERAARSRGMSMQQLRTTPGFNQIPGPHQGKDHAHVNVQSQDPEISPFPDHVIMRP